MTETSAPGTELTRSFITDEWLARAVKLDNLNDVAALFVTDFGFDIFDTERDGIFQPELIKDKDKLSGVPFAITRWRSAASDKYTTDSGEQGSFAVVEVMYPKLITDSAGNAKNILTPAVFTDGGVGVAKTLREVTNRRMAYNAAPERKRGELVDPFGGLGVMGGLVKSEYDTVDSHGEAVHGVTYYLDFTPKS